MTNLTESEVIEVGDLDPEQWNDYAEEQGWGDGMPLMVPTEEKVAALVAVSYTHLTLPTIYSV